MSSSPHLTDAEVAEITEPLTQGAARRHFFERLGCKVKQKPNGQPLVGRAEYEAALTSRGARAQAAQERPPAPDWDKLKRMGGRPLRAV